MKVIAKIDNNKVLCEISADEIARLYGATSTYDSSFRRDWVEVGTVHELGVAITTLDTLRKFDGKQLNYLKSSIDEMTKHYDKILDAYNKLVLFDKLKEAE